MSNNVFEYQNNVLAVYYNSFNFHIAKLHGFVKTHDSEEPHLVQPNK